MDCNYNKVPEGEEAWRREPPVANEADERGYRQVAAMLRSMVTPRKACMLFLASLALVASAGLVLGSTATRAAMQSMTTGGDTGARIDGCGEAPAQARARCCRYDVMLQQWVPLACYDEEHSEMYLSTYRWKWYYDIDAKREMPDEVMRRGEHKVAFMDDSYHRHHCAYVWEVSARALQRRKPMLDEWLSYKHTHHCNTLLLSPPWNSTSAKHATAVETHSGYGRCAPYLAWAREMPE